jgi:hypothetical protein
MWLVLAAGGLLGSAVCAFAESYSDAQIELAGKIGAAVALSRICTGTVPTTAVIATLEASGLTESDLLEDTPIHERMQREASAVMQAHQADREAGKPQAEIVKSACEGFRASFGPDGLVVPEVAGASR